MNQAKHLKQEIKTSCLKIETQLENYQQLKNMDPLQKLKHAVPWLCVAAFGLGFVTVYSKELRKQVATTGKQVAKIGIQNLPLLLPPLLGILKKSNQ